MGNRAYELNGEWINAGEHKGELLDIERTAVSNELERRYAIKRKKDGVVDSTPGRYWSDENRWDRD